MTSTHTFAAALAAVVCSFSSFVAAQPKVVQWATKAEAPQAQGLFRLTFGNPKVGMSTLSELDCDTGEAIHSVTLPMFLSPFAGAAHDNMSVYVLDDVGTSSIVPVAALHPETGDVVETFGVPRLTSATRYSDLAFLPIGPSPGKLYTNAYTDTGLNRREVVCFDAGTGAIDHCVEPTFDGEPVADGGSLSGLTGDAQRGVLYSAYHPDGGGDVWAIAIDPDNGAASLQVLIPDAQNVTGLAVCGQYLIAAGVDRANLPIRTAIDLDTGETRAFGPIGDFDSALAGDNVVEIADVEEVEIIINPKKGGGGELGVIDLTKDKKVVVLVRSKKDDEGKVTFDSLNEIYTNLQKATPSFGDAKESKRVGLDRRWTPFRFLNKDLRLWEKAFKIPVKVLVDSGAVTPGTTTVVLEGELKDRVTGEPTGRAFRGTATITVKGPS